jgi:hypothetical protein
MKPKKTDDGCTFKHDLEDCEIICEEEVDFVFPKDEFNKELLNFWKSMVDSEEPE